MKEQFNYINNKSLGFKKDNILFINGEENAIWGNATMQLQRLKDLAANHPNVVSVGFGPELTGDIGYMNDRLKNQDIRINNIGADFGYTNLMGMRIISGRTLSPDFPTDSSGKERSVVINETLARLLGGNLSIGQSIHQIKNNRIVRNYRVVGIVQDFHTADLSSPIGPTIIEYDPFISNILIRVGPGNLSATLSLLENSWKEWNNGQTLSYTFLDQDLAAQYKGQQHWMDIISIACLIAVIVTAIGLFGLAGLKAANRTKEIGIRKVLGASVAGVVRLLSADFLKYSLIAFAVSVPFGSWCVHHWLENFAYRAPEHWWVFALTGLAAAAIALLSIGFQALKAARANPVKNLRTE